jgi:hypothetical protein
LAAFVWSVPGAGLLDGCWAGPGIETMSSARLDETIERQMREKRPLAIIPVHSFT